MAVTDRERELLDAVADKAGWVAGYTVARVSPRAYDLQIAGTFGVTKFKAWLPLATIHAVDWPRPAIWELSDAYGAAPPPEMEQDWSGIRDSAEETKWKMFEIAERILMGLSRSDEEAYIKRLGSGCPFCGPDGEIGDGGSFDIDGGSCGQELSCLSCGQRWEDQYTLTGIERR